MLSGLRCFVIFTVCLFITVVLILPAYAGWVEVHKNGQKTFISHGKVKSVFRVEEGPEISYIIDTVSGQITMVNSDLKVYASGTPEDYCKGTKAFGEEIRDSVMSQLTPEQRQMMEEQMGAMQNMKPAPQQNIINRAPEVSIVNKGSGGIIAGHKTEKYTVLADGELYEELWIASDISLKKEIQANRMGGMYKTEKRMSKCMGSMDMGMKGMNTNDPTDTPEYEKLIEEGWVLKAVMYMPGYFGEGNQSQTVTDIVKLEKRSIPDSEFKVPSGYRSLSVAEMMRGMMHAGEK